jgi:hypothetical protein
VKKRFAMSTSLFNALVAWDVRCPIAIDAGLGLEIAKAPSISQGTSQIW